MKRKVLCFFICTAILSSLLGTTIGAAETHTVFIEAEPGAGNSVLQSILPEDQPAVPAPERINPNLVRISRVPQFRNDNVSAEPTNGLIADVVRQNILQIMNHPNPLGGFDVPASAFEQQWSNNLMREIIDVWDDDPASRIFGVNREGMMMQLDQTLMRPWTTLDSQIGIWDIRYREGMFATFRVDGINIVPMDIEDVVHIFLYELFGRGEGYGVLLSHKKAEYIMGTGPARYPINWNMYTGFYHRLGEISGLDNVFSSARMGQHFFSNWIDRQILVMNPNFTFNYEQLQLAKGGAWAIVWNWDYAVHYALRTGITIARINDHLISAWNIFYTATDPAVPYEQRNEAARQFSEIIQNLYQVTTENNFSIGQFSHLDRGHRDHLPVREQVMPSVLDGNKPYINMAIPTAGVFSRRIFNYVVPQQPLRPSIFPEIAG